MRDERFHDVLSSADARTPFQRDRDRVLYSSAFRRLAGVTQVVGASEGFIFHNRLTHSLKVAQLARRIAEKLLAEQPDLAGGPAPVNPDVAETAGLAHDLGHPPFGHVGEVALQAASDPGTGDNESFEGNPQSFRIVTKLAMRTFDRDGLNLTRASLNAMLKYPWLRSTAGPRHEKWGVYYAEDAEFKWARKGLLTSDVKTAEAEIMDWADDIAYSVHDAEDFFRAGIIPLDRLAISDTEQTSFFERAKDHIKIVREGEKRRLTESEKVALFSRFQNNVAPLFPRERFEGTREQRGALRHLTSLLIGRYVSAIRLKEPTADSPRSVEIDEDIEQEVNLLKELTWVYVIRNPALASQQFGQRQIIRYLFETFMNSAEANELNILPLSTRDQVKALADSRDQRALRRIVVDLIASMTEHQALSSYRKLRGLDPGSAMDLLLHQSIG